VDILLFSLNNQSIHKNINVQKSKVVGGKQLLGQFPFLGNERVHALKKLLNIRENKDCFVLKFDAAYPALSSYDSEEGGIFCPDDGSANALRNIYNKI
jgi:hypothetical protein